MSIENNKPEEKTSKRNDIIAAISITFLCLFVIIILFLGLISLVPGFGRPKRPGIAALPMLIDSLNNGLKQYFAEYNKLPGEGSPADPKDPASNVISQVYNALQGTYIEIKEKDIGVIDPATGKARQATPEEIKNPAIDKVILDIWGQPLIARENRSKKVKAPHMQNKDYIDVYSVGINGVDDTVLMKSGEENDDCGNW